MKEARLTDPTTDVGVRRAEVMATLREGEAPLSAAEVAERTGLHVNTARFHLDGLVEDALVDRTVEERETPGRPRILYMARAGAEGPRSYGLLSEMLLGLVATLGEKGEAAVSTGKSWGRKLVEQKAGALKTAPQHISLGSGISVDDAIARLNTVLEAIGFQPEIATSDDGNFEVHLHHCPFREVAEQHTDVVCALHLGLMQGALSELGAPLEIKVLQPFITPDICSAPVRSVPPDAA